MFFIPASFANILSGIKVGWARAWRGLISAEMIFGAAQSAGIGVFINNARTVWIDYASVYAALFLIIFVGVAVEYGVFKTIEKFTVKKMGYGKMSEVLKVTALNKQYNGQNGVHKILDNLNLTVEDGEFVCILGPSGCGKSTLVRCIAGFEKYNGEIICNDKPVTGPSDERIMVFQDYNQLFPWKTVEKNIQYPLKLKGIKNKAELKSISDSFLQLVGLDGTQTQYPHELSGGMKQRIAIARALALKTQYYF